MTFLDPLPPWNTRIARVFWSSLAVVALADVATKYLAHTRLLPQHVPRDVFGDTVRLTLAYNPGAAFGLHLGSYSRWFFAVLAVVALVVLGRLYRVTAHNDWLRALALGLVCGGATGNLINRLWSDRGVVDFIDVGIGVHRWPTFNVADIGITIGAVLLAWVLWQEDRRASARRQQERSPPRSA